MNGPHAAHVSPSNRLPVTPSSSKRCAHPLGYPSARAQIPELPRAQCALPLGQMACPLPVAGRAGLPYSWPTRHRSPGSRDYSLGFLPPRTRSFLLPVRSEYVSRLRKPRPCHRSARLKRDARVVRNYTSGGAGRRIYPRDLNRKRRKCSKSQDYYKYFLSTPRWISLFDLFFF